VLYRGQKEALAEFLPLEAENWITCGNALRLDWLSICPPTGTGVKLQADDLFNAAGSGADRLRERGRRNLHLRFRLRHLCPQRRIDQGQCPWHAADAGARL
jgi:hypothetical protein